MVTIGRPPPIPSTPLIVASNVAAFHEIIDGVREEMMVAMLQTLQDAATQCANICVERLCALHMQMVDAVEEESNSSNRVDLFSQGKHENDFETSSSLSGSACEGRMSYPKIFSICDGNDFSGCTICKCSGVKGDADLHCKQFTIQEEDDQQDEPKLISDESPCLRSVAVKNHLGVGVSPRIQTKAPSEHSDDKFDEQSNKERFKEHCSGPGAKGVCTECLLRQKHGDRLLLEKFQKYLEENCKENCNSTAEFMSMGQNRHSSFAAAGVRKKHDKQYREAQSFLDAGKFQPPAIQSTSRLRGRRCTVAPVK